MISKNPFYFLAMAGSNSTSTREKLLGLVDDIELITKEILENAIAPKAKRLSANEHDELTTLMIQKDSELKETMKLASEQGELDKKMKLLQDEVQKQDNHIKQLQKQLKEAETVLVSQIIVIYILCSRYKVPNLNCPFKDLEHCIIFQYFSVNSHLSSTPKTRLHSKS